MSSQQMKRGSKGALGGGVYFAKTAAATNKKALSRGVILKCHVRLGKQKTLKAVDPTVTFASLLNEGYDSVVCDAFASGTEYVVYNYDQVVKIERC